MEQTHTNTVIQIHTHTHKYIVQKALKYLENESHSTMELSAHFAY